MSQKKNPGKIFEANWKMRSEKQGILTIRLKDSDLSFNPNRELRSKFTAENPCDFVQFYKGHLFTLELKSTKYKSLSIQLDPDDKSSKMIKLHQINSLVNFSLYENVEAGLVLNFRHENDNGVVEEEETYYLPIDKFSDFLTKSGKSSINQVDVVLYGGYQIDTTKIKVNFNYNVKDMMEAVIADRNKAKKENG